MQTTVPKISEDERQAIRQTAAAFCRSARDGTRVLDAMVTATGHDARVWERMSRELGFTSLLVPEHLGGLGLGFAEAAIVLAEAGRTLLPSPLLPTLAMTQVLVHLRSPSASELLQKRIANGASATLAFGESPFARTSAEFSTRAEDTAGGAVLSGAKRFVLNGDSADILIVAASSEDGAGLYAVEGTAPGVIRTGQPSLDQTRRLATVEFEAASATRLQTGDATAPIGGAEAAMYAENIMLVALAVEAAAAAQECLERTVEYLKVREQFGRVLGSFQALRHRCAWMAVQVEGALATAKAAVASIDSPDLEVAAPLARAVCGDAFMFVAGEMIQLHGGIGFTFEHPAHLYFKRAKSTQLLFGSSDELRQRVGALVGI
jgi:alkylation response protein AidB-like acyl-CoA dehydrogenase